MTDTSDKTLDALVESAATSIEHLESLRGANTTLAKGAK